MRIHGKKSIQLYESVRDILTALVLTFLVMWMAYEAVNKPVDDTELQRVECESALKDGQTCVKAYIIKEEVK